MAFVEYQHTRGDYWNSEEDPNVAPPVWLGAFNLEIRIRCMTQCGAFAVARATWLHRGRPLVLELCATCCKIAYDASQNRVRTIQPPPPKQISERSTPMRRKSRRRLNEFRSRA